MSAVFCEMEPQTGWFVSALTSFLKRPEHPCHSVSLTQQLTAQICAEHISTYPLAVCGLNDDAGRHPGTGTGAVAGSLAYLLTRGIKQVVRGGGMRWGSGAVGLGGEKLWENHGTWLWGVGVVAAQPHPRRLWSLRQSLAQLKMESKG